MKPFHRFTLAVSIVLGMTTDAPAQAPAPTSPTRTVLAGNSLPTVVDVPHHFVVQRLALTSNARVPVSGNGFLYVVTGTVTTERVDKRTTFREGDATSTETNTETILFADGSDAVALHFVLHREGDRLPPIAPHAQELYRTPSAIPGLKPGLHEFTFVRVSFPSHMALNKPHYRSGAAIYYVLSGTGLFVSGEKREERPTGSLQYEPNDLIHQWGNPGDIPLVFLQANINQEGVPAVIFK
jgi:quercetin dioxygenase-like cupin family protein